MLKEQLAKHRYTDSGFDIPLIDATLNFAYSNSVVVKFNLGIKVAAVGFYNRKPFPCLLLPRSSISKTPYRLTNSIGLIDAGYRGEVAAMCDFEPSAQESIEKGSRLFQLCQHNFMPWQQIVIVDSLEKLPVALDNRGENGFGSTGR